MIYSVTIKNKVYYLKLFDYIYIDEVKHLFLGIVNKTINIPILDCIYISDNKVIKQSIKRKDNLLTFQVPGVPKTKGRPRFRRFGNFVTTYSDSKTVQAEKNIRNVFLEKNNTSNSDNDCAIGIDMIFDMKIPESISKKKREELNNTPHTKKPDIDNLVKAVLDSLNKVAFKDDSQIFKLYCLKKYSYDPKTVVNLEFIKKER